MSAPTPDYVILFFKDTAELEKRVVTYLAAGYTCVGGVAVSPGTWFYQAMVKPK